MDNSTLLLNKFNLYKYDIIIIIIIIIIHIPLICMRKTLNSKIFSKQFRYWNREKANKVSVLAHKNFPV